MKRIVIVGAGPTGLFVAENLLNSKEDLEVVLCDRMRSVGNKFLVAGKSGLNITHSESIEKFSEKYFQNQVQFKKWFESFDNKDLIQWVNSLGVETFIGSSGRVFPKTFKAAQLIKVWMDKLNSDERFSFVSQVELKDFNEREVIFEDRFVSYDKLVFALGGASWKKTGSNGEWQNLFLQKGIKVKPFKALNCGFNTDFPFDYKPIKYCSVSYKNKAIKGDLMLTPYGIEGSPIYYLSHYLIQDKKPQIEIDLLPDLSYESIVKKLSSKKSMNSKLKQILSVEAIELLKRLTTKEEYQSVDLITKRIKKLPLVLNSSRVIDEAISTHGGVDFSELNSDFSLKKYSQVYVGGEMLDWDAPTGGYLLQGCFTQAFIISQNLLQSLR